MIALWCPQFSKLIMTDVLMPETQQPIILIINSFYFLKGFVEYISDRTTIIST